jgi:hypothetical protein
MKKSLFLSLSTFFCLQAGFSQGDALLPIPLFNGDPLEIVQDQAVMDSLALWEEKVYLHTDRTRAEAGEAIFFKAYVFNTPTRRRLSPSGVLKVELRDSENALVASQYHPLREGAGQGVVRLPKRIAEGTYRMLAYTRWMENYGEGQYFSTEIEVGEAPKKEEALVTENRKITFYPEGGRLLAGVQNRLVVRTSAPEHIGLQGHIVDEAGRVLVPVQEYGSGFGMAIFRPEAGRQYQLETSQGTKLDLPGVVKRGYSLKVNNLEADKLSLEVQPTEGLSREPVVLKGERDGKTYFIHMLEFEKEPVALLEIPKAGLPTGFMDFSLTSLDETVWTRRPVWIDLPGRLNIEVEPLSTDFGEGGEGRFRIRVTDPEGNPVQTDLSVSVTAGSDTNPPALPAYLSPFAEEKALWDGRQNRFLQDLKAQALASQQEGRTLPGEIRYPVQRSLELHGTAYDLDNNLLANTEIQMLASSDSTLVIREAKTDASGVLHLEGLNVIGETQFVFRTKGAEQEQRLVKVLPVKETPKKGEKNQVVKSKTYQKATKRKELVETTPVVPFDTTGVIKLREATVQKHREQRKVVPSLYGIEPNPFDIVYQDMEKPLPIDLLIRKIPGMQSRPTVDGLPVITHMRRGGGGVLWVVDGQIIRNSGARVLDGQIVRTSQDPYLSPLTFLTPRDILRIEFIMDAGNTSIFGVQGNTGVMLVYTRSGNFLDYEDRKEGGLLFKGYEPTLEFETWLSERQENRKLRRKDPKTLYWNPEVRTDKKGEATIRFESPGEYNGVRLSVETLTKEGLIGSFQNAY